MKSRKIAILALLTAMMFLPGLVGPAPVGATPEWVGVYDGGDNDVAKALVMKENGASFVCGNTIVDGQSDILIQKRKSDGTVDLMCVFDCPGHKPDYVEAAARDSVGAVFAVGFTYLEGGSKWRIVNCKWGIIEWTATYNGPAGKYDAAEDVAIDYNPTPNEVYVAGWSQNADDTKDLVLQKYSADSNVPAWTDRVPNNPVSLEIENPVHVEVDSGAAYLAGTVLATYGKYAWGLKKYWSNGSSSALLYFGNSSVDRELRDMAAASGYVYLTGKETTDEEVRMVTLKFAFAGGGGWEKVVTFSGHDVTGTNVAVDSSGNVYVLGRCTEPVNITTSLLVKYDASGTELWQKTFTTSPSGNQSLLVDGIGRPVVTAQSYPDNRYLTRWFDPADGDISHEELYPDPGGHGYPAAVGVDSSNNVYVTGSGRFDAVWPSDPDQDIRTLKYAAP